MRTFITTLILCLACNPYATAHSPVALATESQINFNGMVMDSLYGIVPYNSLVEVVSPTKFTTEESTGSYKYVKNDSYTASIKYVAISDINEKANISLTFTTKNSGTFNATGSYGYPSGNIIAFFVGSGSFVITQVSSPPGAAAAADSSTMTLRDGNAEIKVDGRGRLRSFTVDGRPLLHAGEVFAGYIDIQPLKGTLVYQGSGSGFLTNELPQVKKIQSLSHPYNYFIQVIGSGGISDITINYEVNGGEWGSGEAELLVGLHAARVFPYFGLNDIPTSIYSYMDFDLSSNMSSDSVVVKQRKAFSQLPFTWVQSGEGITVDLIKQNYFFPGGISDSDLQHTCAANTWPNIISRFHRYSMPTVPVVGEEPSWVWEVTEETADIEASNFFGRSGTGVHSFNDVYQVRGVPSLVEELDLPESWLIRTGGDNGAWFARFGELRAGNHGTPDSESWIEFNAVGPGVLRFEHAVSSEEGLDSLSLTLDGVTIDEISGQREWIASEIDIPAGTHQIRWSYAKNSSIDQGEDVGMLKAFVFEPLVGFAAWPVLATLPADRRGPLDRNGPLEVQNLLAYAMALDPLTATAADLPQVVSVDPIAGHATFRYRRATNRPDVTLSPLTSTDLSGWDSAVVQSTTIVQDGGDWEVIEIHVPAPPEGSLFFKLMAQ